MPPFEKMELERMLLPLAVVIGGVRDYIHAR